MNFSIKDFFSKCDQIRRKLRIWSHLLKNFLVENFIFCAVKDKMINILVTLKLMWTFEILKDCLKSNFDTMATAWRDYCFPENLECFVIL